MPSNPVLAEARRLSLLGAARTANPLTAKKQIRVEVTPACMCFCTVDSGRLGNFYFEPSINLDSAFAAFEKQAASRRLLNKGTVLIFNITSELFKTTPLDIGANKQYKKVVELDILARRDPSQLRLDPAHFCYRALKTTDTQAHLISLEIGSSENYDFDLRGLRVERYSLILSTVDYLLDRHEDYFSPQTLLCIADNNRGFLFAMRRGAITGIRTISRSAISSPKEFRDTAQSFSFDGGPAGDGYSIVLASTTSQIDDLERAGKNMAGDIVSNVGLIGYEDICAAVPEMQNFKDAPQYPMSLFRIGKSEQSLPFYTVKESSRPPLNTAQLLQISMLRLVRILLILAAILSPLASAFYYYQKSHTPEWNVNMVELDQKENRLRSLLEEQAYVNKGIKISNTRLSLANLLSAIFTDFPENFRLTRIEQPAPIANSYGKWQVFIMGTCPEDGVGILQDYVKAIDGRIRNSFLNFETKAQLLETSIDPSQQGNAKLRKFRIQLDFIKKS